MRPEELGGLIFAVCLVEDKMKNINEVVDLMKLINALQKQNVSYGNFTLIFAPTSSNIIARFHEISDILMKSSHDGIELIKTILEDNQLNQESPFGTFIQSRLINLDNYPIISLPHLLNSFQKWISDKTPISLPTLLSPDALFSPPDFRIILSPIPSTGFQNQILKLLNLF